MHNDPLLELHTQLSLAQNCMSHTLADPCMSRPEVHVQGLYITYTQCHYACSIDLRAVATVLALSHITNVLLVS